MGKSERKAGQAARREARLAMRDYRDTLMEKLGAFNKVLKPKPKWIHSKIWSWFCSKVIDLDQLSTVLNIHRD